MSKSQREKGARGEREFAHLIGGQKIPLSGAVAGYIGDVKGLGLIWQVKTRKGGYKLIYDALKGHDALAIKQDYHEWLVVMPVETLYKLLDAASTGSHNTHDKE